MRATAVTPRRRRWRIALALALVVWPVLTVSASAEAVLEPGCAAHFDAAEAASGIPPGLLASISLAETGGSPYAGRAGWPWTINAEGQGRFFATKAEAIAEVQRLRLRGVRSIDAGCMQVNLMFHPDAFASLDEAFDPAHGVAYAARFLRELKNMTGSWEEALGRYHSADPLRGGAYRRHVLAEWSGGERAIVVAEADIRPGNGGAWRQQQAALQKLAAAGRPLRLARLIIVGGDGGKGRSNQTRQEASVSSWSKAR